MSRNAFLILAALYSYPSFATPDSPIVQGLAGATRAGVAREAVFSNPASVNLITTNFAFYHYEIPSIPDYNAGGRAFNVGLYDGAEPDLKAAIDYSRISKARIFAGQQGYIDRSEIRLALGHALVGPLVAGVNGRLVKNYNDPGSASFFEGDAGLATPIFTDLRAGLTFENILNREDENPQTVGVGAAYNVGYGIQVVADGSRLMQGSKSGAKGWSLAGEFGLANDFSVRGGIFREAYRGFKGWALGLSWAGPRMSLDYAFKSVGGGPTEHSHILGMTLVM
jgi:hypothetical protein